MIANDTFPLPRRPNLASNWPLSWRESYHYDRLEVWDDRKRPNSHCIGYVWSYASRRRQTIEAVLKAMPPPAHVLDLASAQGNFAITLAALGYKVTWNDLRAELADYVRMKSLEGTDLEFVAGNVFELGDVHLGRYDVVLATEIIEHVAHPDKFIAKLATLLRPGGVLVLSTPNGGYFLNRLPRFSDCPDPSVFESMQFKPNSDGHIFLIHEDELRCFANSAGLEILHLDLITNPLTAGHFKLRYLLRLLPNGVVGYVESSFRAMPASFRRRLSVHMVIVLCKSAEQGSCLAAL